MISQEDKLQLYSEYLQNLLILNAPKDTFNLAMNAIRLVQVEANQWRIVIGGEIAPYAIYTVNQTHVNKYTGKTNYDWINRTIEESIPFAQQLFGGAMSDADIQQMVKDSTDEIETGLNEQFGG